MTEIKETLKERGSKYGTMADNSKITQALMAILHEADNWNTLPAIHRECLHMIMHKISRMVCGDYMHEDNPLDIAGYALLLKDWIREHKDD